MSKFKNTVIYSVTLTWFKDQYFIHIPDCNHFSITSLTVKNTLPGSHMLLTLAKLITTHKAHALNYLIIPNNNKSTKTLLSCFHEDISIIIPVSMLKKISVINGWNASSRASQFSSNPEPDIFDKMLLWYPCGYLCANTIIKTVFFFSFQHSL